ncbi:formate dehydrogenase subunit gamma [Caenispirillum salinarum]|uniref:formate dehydrogenase subunit gamma n=1 Tax=Caenispirillum salinarum TaxID=859058 RepID=UPI00384EE385
MLHRALQGLVPLLAALLIATAALAQDEVGVGAGRDVNEPVSPGLEQQTPGPLTDFRLVGPEEKTVGRVSIPDETLATLIQPEGRDWRTFRMEYLPWGGGIAILLMLAALTAFYLIRGRIDLDSGKSGRWVPRFSGLDRFAHWTTAVSFLLLAISGLVITFGRHILIPVMGHFAFEPLVDAMKYIHNFAAPSFVVGLVLMLVLWIKDNIPGRDDVIWVRELGGLMKKGSSHPGSGRFNAGQKGIFWLVVLGGFVMAASGVTLLLPFYWADVGGMQVAHVIHAILGMVFVIVILGHIYIGTIGMEGAFDAMGKGRVDENWAREHHGGWYEKVCNVAPSRSAGGGAAGAGAGPDRGPEKS